MDSRTRIDATDTPMSTFQIKPATRQGVRPLIGLFGESGTGKTFSSLLLARGFVGPKGKIGFIDTESGRGSLYSDIKEIGGYDVLELTEPFSPVRMIEAMAEIEKAGYSIGCIDSASHEWEGIGGVLSMAADNEEHSKRAGLHNWRTPKMEHAKFVLKLLQSPIPWIVCLRAKYKTRQMKDDKGKTQIVKDEMASPIQAEDFIFELTCHAQVFPDHSIVVTKEGHPELRKCFPENNKEPISIRHGEALAKWCNAAGAPFTPSAPAQKELKTALWKLTEPHHAGDVKKFETYLRTEPFIGANEVVADLSATRLGEIIEAIKKQTSTPQTP